MNMVYIITNTVFSDNYGYDGTIVNIKQMKEFTKILFKNSSFIRNVSINNGGVLYSESDLTDVNVAFIDCIFEDNYSYEGLYIIKFFQIDFLIIKHLIIFIFLF